MTMLNFNVLKVIGCFCLLVLVRSDDFSLASLTSYTQFDAIRRGINTLIVSSSHSAKSFAHCAYKCSRSLSVSLYFIANTEECFCNHNIDSNTDDDNGTQPITYGLIKSTEISKFKDITKWNIIPWMTDCLELYNAGYTQDGVYTIQPPGQTAVDTWCDMVAGGWTVVQRREDGSEDFYRGWADYQSGFGNRTGEYWLGLDNIHALTSNQSEASISFEAFEDVNPKSATLSFASFAVHDLSSKYTLSIAGYSNTCNKVSPFEGIENGMKFSTKDMDNDKLGSNCAVAHKGAWWYNNCHHMNINGQYLNGAHGSFGNGIIYNPCWGFNYSLKKTTMRVRRKMIP